MEMRRSDDSSGTDDDLPPAQAGPIARAGRAVGNGKAGGAAPSYATPHANRSIDQLVRTLEQEAYTAVLRAFGAQSEVITWDKERLISELRKELRVSDEQHRDFLAKVHGEDSLRQVREWRESGEGPSAAPPSSNAAQGQPVPASRKKHKTGAVSQVSMPPPPVPPAKQQQSSLASVPPRKAAGAVPRGKSKGGGHEKSSSGGRRKAELQESLVGQTIKMRWPEDNNFYDAYVKEHHKEDGTHTLIYDIGTEKATSERVDLAKVPEGDMLLPKKKEKNGGKRKATPPDRPGSQKWTKIERKGAVRRVTIPSVDSLSKQVEDLGHEPDLSKIEQTKRLAKEHEDTLRKVLEEVGESSDEGESDARERGSNGPKHRNGYSRMNSTTTAAAAAVVANNNSDDENGRRHGYSDGRADQKAV